MFKQGFDFQPPVKTLTEKEAWKRNIRFRGINRHTGIITEIRNFGMVDKWYMRFVIMHRHI